MPKVSCCTLLACQLVVRGRPGVHRLLRGGGRQAVHVCLCSLRSARDKPHTQTANRALIQQDD